MASMPPQWEGRARTGVAATGTIKVALLHVWHHLCMYVYVFRE
jgi:hypothetical protein